MQAEDELLETAMNTLAVHKYCKPQAIKFSKCLNTASSPKYCEAQQETFKYCCKSNQGAVIHDLLAVASLKCKPEVARYQQCKQKQGSAGGGSARLGCDAEDKKAMVCAALHILSAAAATP